MSSTHGYNLRANVKSRADKRVKDMVDAYGGPEWVIGKPSATGLGVHLIFRSESTQPIPRPRPSTRAPPKGDVEMTDSSESESGSSSDSDMDSSESSSSSDTGTVEPNAPRGGRNSPSLALRTPKRRHTEDLQPKGCQEASRRKVSEDVEAARRRVEAQRLKDAKRIHIEQLQKQVRVAACQLRQRADDLERETAEGAARLLREMEDTASTPMDEDEGGFDVRSNRSYTPTETSESSDDESWLSPPLLRFHTPTPQTRHIEEGSPAPTLPATPPPSQMGPQVPMAGHSQAQHGRPLGRQHAVAIPLASSPTSLPGADTASFVVVTRQVVDGLNDLTGSPMRRTKRYRVHAADLESLHGDIDMKEV